MFRPINAEKSCGIATSMAKSPAVETIIISGAPKDFKNNGTMAYTV
jgi:hypothetical protein